MKLIPTRFMRGLAVAALAFMASAAQAQFVWVDAKGVRQYSDTPPPPSVPLKDILRAPRQPHGPLAAAAAAAAMAAPPAAPKIVANPSVAERNAEFRKRAKEKEEKEQKDAAERSQAAANKDNCERAQIAKATLDSGARIGVTDKTGERSVMDDGQREQEGRRVNSVLSACK